MNQDKKGNLEKAAWIFLIVGILITITITILFLRNRMYSSDLPIDNEVFGQYGDIIGGVFGTLVSLVSFFLLYETLNEQRRQAKNQYDETIKSFNEQQKQSRIQSENQIFYHLIDKQQNRINNSEINNNKGYKIFEFLTDEIEKRTIERCHLMARNLLCDIPEQIENFQLQKIFMAKSDDFDLERFENQKEEFVSQLLKRDRNDRWEYIKYYFGSVGNEPPNMRKVLRDIGTVSFYKVSFDYRKQVYNEIFQDIIDEFGSFLDGYLKEQEYFIRLINKSFESKLYKDYFMSQMTNYEYLIIFYYLLSGQSTKELALFTIDTKILDSVHKLNGRIIDLPTEEELLVEIENIKIMYETPAANT